MRVRPVGRDQRPWNKGLLVGQKNPLEPKHVWSIAFALKSHGRGATLPSLTWQSTVNFAAVTWSNCD